MHRILDRTSNQQHGQTLLMFVLFMIVLFVFIGLGVDLGFAYITKAKLSKAVDAACLMAVRNISAGTITASAVATNAFYLNYGSTGRDVTSPVPNITFSADANSNVLVDVSATTAINTFFIRVLPQWKTLTVASAAEATRAKLIMSLVLDRSGSMEGNGGATALPPAVTNFISLFDDTRDHVSMITFASTEAVDVPMTIPFKTNVINAVRTIYPSLVAGATYSLGGLTNALIQNATVPIAPGDNVVKVTVFFTDGLANSLRDTLACPPTQLVNFGGQDKGNGYCVWNPTAAETAWAQDGVCDTSKTGVSCGASQFPLQAGGTAALNRQNITDEAELRCEHVADMMRATNTIVYAVGLGNNINVDFLTAVANSDGSRPGQQGIALIAPTSADLQATFQRVADDILLRLTK